MLEVQLDTPLIAIKTIGRTCYLDIVIKSTDSSEIIANEVIMSGLTEWFLKMPIVKHNGV